MKVRYDSVADLKENAEFIREEMLQSNRIKFQHNQWIVLFKKKNAVKSCLGKNLIINKNIPNIKYFICL